jgi:CubicO group peptidase (beta-lactamase class C family)
MKKSLFFIAALICSSCGQEAEISYSGDLQPGMEQAGTLEKSGEVSYRLNLEPESFIYGYVDQKTVDVVVELRDSTGQRIAAFDDPDRGHENFSFEIEEGGMYTLAVTPFKEESGDYSILLKGVEPLAADPEGRIDQMMTFYSGDAPGACIGVVKDGELVFSKAYGKANLTHNIDFTLEMPTNIGSVSKQFTAMAVLLLEQEGKLSLEDDVRKHIPELPDLGQVVTIKNILNHTNGWREVYNMMPIKGWYGEDRLLKQEVIRILQAQTELQAEPNTEYNYNNSAFIMAAEIVERVSGETFPDFVKKNIFEPLGMEQSFVRKDPSTIIPNATQGYTMKDGAFVESGDLDAAYGAGAIYTTPADLALWMNNFESARVGGKEGIDKLVTPGILKNGDTLDYGLGIGVRTYKGLKQYSHGGADIAHRAMLLYFPEIRSGVITLSNNASFSGVAARKIADLYFSESLEEDTPEDSAAESEFTMEAETLEKYTGKFRAEDIGLIIEFKLEDGTLTAYPSGQSSLELNPLAMDSLAYQGIEASIAFKADDSGAYASAIHYQGGNEITLDRLPDYQPDAETLQAFTGRYFSEELETFYEISAKDSLLIASHRNLEPIELSPVEEDNFTGDVFFMGEVTFIRGADGAVIGFTVSNGRTKGVQFDRFKAGE